MAPGPCHRCLRATATPVSQRTRRHHYSRGSKHIPRSAEPPMSPGGCALGGARAASWSGQHGLLPERMTPVVDMNDWLASDDLLAGLPRLRRNSLPYRPVHRVRRAAPSTARPRDAHRVQASPWSRAFRGLDVGSEAERQPHPGSLPHLPRGRGGHLGLGGDALGGRTDGPRADDG